MWNFLTWNPLLVGMGFEKNYDYDHVILGDESLTKLSTPSPRPKPKVPMGPSRIHKGRNTIQFLDWADTTLQCQLKHMVGQEQELEAYWIQHAH